MNSFQIEKILRENAVTKEHFLGVFPLDKIPPVQHPASLVINLQKSNNEGSHWIAIYARDRSTAIYWDSFALLPIKEPIVKYLSQFSTVLRNGCPYQNPFSEVCGQYCIVFIYYMSRGIEFPQFLFILDKHNPDTDLFVKKFVHKMIKS